MGVPGGGSGRIRRARESRRWRKKAPELLLPGEFVHLEEDLLFQELELMQPGRGGDPDIEPAPFHRFGQGPGGDLGTDGPCPEIEEAPVRRGMGGCSSS